MKYTYFWKLSLLLWIGLCFGIPGTAQEHPTDEIRTVEQLQIALSTSLRSDDVKELKITPEGILIDQLITVNPGKFSMTGGPLVRAEGYEGSMLSISDGGSIEVFNTLDGASLMANNALVIINKGGSMTLVGTIQNALNQEHAVAILNMGTFYLNGGTLTNNKDEVGYVIGALGETYLIEGRIINNECSGSILSLGTTLLSPRSVLLSGSDLNMEIENSIGILSNIPYELKLRHAMKEGDTLLYGTGAASLYELTTEDLEQVTLMGTDETLTGVLKDNKIVLAKTVGSGVITTEEELQEAINGAKGTEKDPTVLTIIETGITLTREILVEDQHVLLTGGSITNVNKYYGKMFRINSGSMMLKDITIDGGCRSAEDACWGFAINRGKLYMQDGVILTGFGMVSDVSIIDIFEGGTFVMNGGSITNNYFHSTNLSMASIVTLSFGNFVMNGGEITHNSGDYKLVTLMSKSSTFQHLGGSILNNGEGYITNYNGIITIGCNSEGSIQQQIVIDENSEIRLTQSLHYQLNIRFRDTSKIENGFVLAVGYNHRLTDSDLSYISLPEGYQAKLQDNKIIVETSSSDIKTPDDLQRAIDEAAVGTIDTPTIITLNDDIVLTSTINIEGKHIKIVGAKVIKIASTLNTGGFLMFKVTAKGSLTLEDITLDASYKYYSSFAHVEVSSSLLLMNGTTLQNGKGNPDRAVLEIFGYLKMDHCTFQKNSGYRGMYFGVNSNWDCYGAKIIENTIPQDKFLSSMIDCWGNATIEQTEFRGNQDITMLLHGETSLKSNQWLNNVIDLALQGNAHVLLAEGKNPQSVYYTYPAYSTKNAVLICASKLQNDMYILVDEPTDGMILAKGNDYTLTETDLRHFILDESLTDDWTVLLKDNTIKLTAKEASAISTQEELQAAIDASNGTMAKPTVIKLTSKEIPIYHSILINNKYVTLAGGTLKNAASADLRMFDVASGYLGLSMIVLDGNKSKAKGYCTLIEMNGGSCKIMEGTQLKNAYARSGMDAVVTVASGKLTFEGGEIMDNHSNGGDLIWVSGIGNFEMLGGSIQRNKNTGRYIMAGIEMTRGTMNLNAGKLGDNIGNRYGVYVTKDFTLGGNANITEPIILTEGSKIWVSSALKHTVTIGFTKSYMPSGTIVASGSENYKLTNADVNKFAYRYANKYDFKLDGNNIVLSNPSAVDKSYKVTVKRPVNGSLITDKILAKENDWVNITATPHDGYSIYYVQYCANFPGVLNVPNKITSSSPNIYSFKMPASDVDISAMFTIIKVMPFPNIEPSPENPTPLQPGETIEDIDDLIRELGGDNPDKDGSHELVPDSKKPDLNDEPISEAIDDAKDEGDDYIDSIEELIDQISKDASGKIIKSKTWYQLPCKVGLRIYLPDRLIVSEELRASGTANYYILNQCEGKVTKIIPTYNPDDNSLIFKTDKLGIFSVMNSNSPLANEVCLDDEVRLYTANGNIVIKGLEPGKPYQIFDISGRILKSGIAESNTVYFRPESEGNYIVRCGEKGQIIHFKN